MKVFISYSINDNDQYLLTLLVTKLREKFHIVSTSQNFYSNVLDYNTQNEIMESHLFLGVLTGQGLEKNRVQDEWRFAQSRNVPTILLIEDSVQVNRNFNGDYIIFNRYNPQDAIDIINYKMNPPVVKNNSSEEAMGWLLGGAAVLAILALLSGKK